ncbi:MAG: tetratricopeptide repeat protein, partial [Gemmatimonadetes bacterium]|nr:tetratricopeptide repeat protein [Gemmatimonadota bacterium]
KPSNVLVTGDATVKLLDFGIAKVFDPEESGDGDSEAPAPDVTVTAERYFTPAYAAPEQVLGEPTSTATDVFALGVLLYEILTGRNPHGETTRSGELARAVVETDPPSPSTVVGDVAAAARATTISDLRQKLRGDLDNILQKSLRKAPEERYSSVEDLRLDLERFRRQLPVSVRRATLPYRFAKYARRHRVAATALVALALAVVAGMVGVAWQANVAARERDRARAEAGRAEAVKDYLLEVFTAADPTQEPGGADVTARELAERGASRLDERLTQAPELRADLEGLLGQVFLRVAEYERADSLLASAGAQFRRSGRSRDAVQALLNRADVAHWQARAADAEALCRESLALAEAELPADDVLRRTARSSLATALIDQGHYEDAAREYDVALRAAQAAHDEPDAEVAQLWMEVGVVRRALGDYPGAAEAAEEALRIARQAEPGGGLKTARILGSLADILDEVDRPDEAAQAGREAVEMYRRMFGDRGHPELAMTLVNLAGAVRAQGDLEEAIELGREGVDEFTKALGAEHPHVAQSWNNLAVTLNRAGHKEEALEAYSSAVRLGRAALGRGHPRLAPWLANYANALVNRGDYAGAEQIYDEAMEIVRGPDSEPVANTYVMLGLANVYRKTNRAEASERLTREAWQIRKDTVGSGHSAELHARITLGSLLSESGKFEEARELLDSSIVDARAGGGPTQGRLVQALDERAILARQAGESTDSLASFLRELLAARREANPDDPRVAKLEEELARLGS